MLFIIKVTKVVWRDSHEKNLFAAGHCRCFGFIRGGMQDTQAAPVEQTAAAQTYKAVLNVDGHKLPVTLRNEPSAADLYNRLPVTLEFKDFSGMEKIAYFDKRLDEKGQRIGCHPLAGDLCVYQPWGNLSIFYVDFKDDPNLIPIGRLEEGLDIIKAQTGNFTATLEKAE